MPQRNEPVTKKSKVEDESLGHGSEKHGKHREQDEALPGKGSSKGGLNRDSGAHSNDPSKSTRGGRQGGG
ncbi:MAG TPA: hypothetical protein VF039_10930 [Longimicrobiales bacterium]